MIVAIILLPVCIIILNIWLWLFQNIFEFQKNKSHIITITIIMGLISGLSIMFYPKLVAILGYNDLDFTNLKNLTNSNIYYAFYVYLSSIIIMLKLFINKGKLSKFFLLNFGLFSLIYLLFGFFGFRLQLETILIYYIFVGAGEEFIKYFAGVNFFEQNKLTNNDILVFSILSAIGFAFIENIVYMVGGLTNDSFFTNLMGGTSILITRGIIGFLVHIIFTGNIGLLALFGFVKNNIAKFLIVGISLGVGLHYIYDVLLQKKINFIVILFFIIGYLWISYLFYISDRIYLKNGLQSY